MSTPVETMRPPEPPGPLLWIRQNLFNNWFNSLLTVFSFLVIYWFSSAFLRWALTGADWRPVLEYPLLFMIGQYSRDQLWRVGLSLSIVCLLMGFSWGVWRKLMESFAIILGALLALAAVFPVQMDALTFTLRGLTLMNVALIYAGFIVGRRKFINGRNLTYAWLAASIVITLVLLPGFEGSNILPSVPTTLWGGLLVTMLLAIGGIALSFPIGVFLALGRRSSLPVVKWFSIAFIECIRGVPLITILFMFSLILQVFLPIGSRFDRLLRALIGITIFSAAYMAENVRGGLAAVPPGQVEAAKAVGMNGLQINLFIVLPQALRVVIPAIVGQFISLFKDTTLVIILGINELLGIGRAVINTDPEFVQLQLEVYTFIALVFWIFSYAMSYSSRQLEAALGVGER
ncbi:MAG: amino acid ABC transporter permease [Anaerolineales bacterium]|nr:amino acid ABC transporter permease [Anaerolineales bacterium]